MQSIDDLFKEVELVVFDVDGTLADTSKKLIIATNNFLYSIGLDPVNVNWISEHVLPTTTLQVLEQIETEFGYSFNEDYEMAIMVYESMCVDAGRIHTKPFPKATDVIEHIAHRGKNIAFATNASRYEFSQTFEILNKSTILNLHRFPTITCDEVKSPKPHRDMMDYIFRELDGVIPYIMIGDTKNDILLANNTKPQGRTILLETTTTLQKMNLSKNQSPDFTYKSMVELHDALRGK